MEPEAEKAKRESMEQRMTPCADRPRPGGREASRFVALPDEMLLHVFGAVVWRRRTVAALLLTCRRFHATIMAEASLWRGWYFETLARRHVPHDLLWERAFDFADRRTPEASLWQFLLRARCTFSHGGGETGWRVAVKRQDRCELYEGERKGGKPHGRGIRRFCRIVYRSDARAPAERQRAVRPPSYACSGRISHRRNPLDRALIDDEWYAGEWRKGNRTGTGICKGATDRSTRASGKADARTGGGPGSVGTAASGTMGSGTTGFRWRCECAVFASAPQSAKRSRGREAETDPAGRRAFACV